MDDFKALRRILIVDDMPAMRSILRDMLPADWGVEVLDFEDADSAWAYLQSTRGQEPSLLLLDVVLPGMSGLDLVRAIRSQPEFSGIRILMVTSEGRLDHVDEAMRCGADGYLVKPFQQSRLLEWVRAFQ